MSYFVRSEDGHKAVIACNNYYYISNMKKSMISLSFIYLLLINLQSFNAQSTDLGDSTFLKWKLFFNQSYGTDYNLVNGIRYLNLYPSAEGHPFLGEDRFYNGKLVVNNKVYQDVEIKYDIYNQEIILQYPYFSGSTDKIVLVEEFIDEFEMDGKLFRKYTFPETAPRFYQVVFQGNISCLYYWKKDLLKGSSAQSFYKYAPEKKIPYLVIDEKLCFFRGRKSFVELLPSKYQKEIRLYLRSNNIWLRDANELTIQQLLNHCNKLVQEN
jgi:hypothetical protein